MAGRHTLNRGDVRWYRFASPDKRRPVLVLGQDSILRSSSQIPVIPLSTQIRGLPWEVLVGPDEGLLVQSVLKPEWIRSVAVGDIGPWICSFPDHRLGDVRTVLLVALGLDASL